MALGNKWSRPPACAPCGPRPLDPPVGGTFHFENLIMPPLTKTCPKMVLSDKGGSLCVKDFFAKKNFLLPGEIPLAACSHQFFGNTLVKAGHLMQLSVVSGTVRGLALQGGQGLAAPIQRPRQLRRIRASIVRPTCACVPLNPLQRPAILRP